MPPRTRAAAAAAAPSASSALPSLLWMLAVSSAMALAQQYVVNARATHKSTLSVSWTMYAADALLAALSAGEGKGGKAATPRRLRLAVASVPAFDIAGCLLAYFGLERLGAGPFTLYFSVILALSALLSRLVLGKRLSAPQLAGIVLVTAGLVARSLLSGTAAGGDDAAGVALTLASTTAYAARTVGMEWLRAQPGAPSGAALSSSIGRWGFAALTTWQLLYTLPRWHALVALPSAAAGVTVARAARVHAAYVLSRMAFVRAQVRVIATAGATGVGLVTAVRSVVVALLGALLFCSTTPSQCLSATQAGCAAVVVAGGVIYALAPPPPPPPGKKRD